ncbi:hypothetical protein [Sediminibacterium ginsengisoli]|uniref:Lipocalin-like domain-containing protein n=1 Tax=Sediminibacterium ginsengisoli TaxID=413434 RepID=A0A1T4M0D4_9BACT|nr:hypothetical protein [Sediminibacterium ginsengisoli]SJZ60372.1 hypothetical protein SAMN04488132_10388 [Sediminibacterium ginsengisoli]
MKSFIRILIPGCLALLQFSCSKEQNQNISLHKKWKLIATFNGYLMGGDFQWHDVPESYTHTLEFTASGKYDKRMAGPGIISNCTGTYQSFPGGRVDIVSGCQTVTETVKVSELSAETLILDHQVTEGVTRDKYVAISIP